MIERRIIDRNYTGGRAGQAPQFVVIHTYNGVGRSLYNWFNSPQAQVSAHYAIFLDGNGEQYVEEHDTAWHASNWDANTKSIGIEHQDNGNPNDGNRTNEMYETTAQLIADIYRRYGWDKKNKGLIKPHKEYAQTGCPGGLDINRIRNRVYEILNPIVDKYYRIFVDGIQISANTDVQNVVNYYYYNSNKNIKVTYQNKDITSQIKTMATEVQKEIEQLKLDKKELSNKNNELISKVAKQVIEVQDLKAAVDVLNEKITNLETKVSSQTQELAKHQRFTNSIFYTLYLFFNERSNKQNTPE